MLETKRYKLPNDFEIRDFMPEDMSALNRLWERTGVGGAHRGDNLDIIKKTISGGGKLLLLVQKSTGKLAGSSWLTNDQRRIYLHHFGIDPEFQAKGLANPLCHESVRFAKEAGLQIKLEVHKDNEIAKTLYSRQGFNYLGDYLVYIIRNYDSFED